MASAYVVSLPSEVVAPTSEAGCNAVVVYANDATDAKAMAKAMMRVDANSIWSNATVTAIGAASNILGFRFHVREFTELGVLAREADITATGAGQDTIDEIGTALATALGGGASYNTTSQVLELSASGDGDHSLEVNVYPPEGQDFGIPGFIASTTHRGSAGSALSFTLCADAFALPKGYGRFKLVR